MGPRPEMYAEGSHGASCIRLSVWCKEKLLKALHTEEMPVSTSWRMNRSGEE